MENYGGNYTKLTLDWHTGIKIGAYFGYGGIRFYNDSITSSGTQVFSIAEGDSNVRVNNALYVGTSQASSDIFMNDSDEGTRRIHCNSNRIGFLNQSDGWGAYCSDNGDWTTDTISYAGASHRAPIFYDSNNTGYYTDPASTSNLNGLTVGTTTLGDTRINFASGGGGYTFSANHYSMGKDIANSGWSSPHYSDLIIGYHTGIRLGAQYSGIRFYNNSPTTDANNDGNGDGGEGLLMTVGGYVGTANHTDVVVNNNLFANVSMRSPIFYDSGNTAYYTDPASTSRMNAISLDQVNVGDGTYLFSTGTTSGTTRHLNMSSYGGDPSQAHTGQSGISWGYRTDSQAYYMIYLTYGDYSAHTKLTLSWHTGIRIGAAPEYGGTAFYNNSLNVSPSLIFSVGRGDSNVRVTNNLYAPIRYDSDNTAYYTDPASTSNLSRLTVAGRKFAYSADLDLSALNVNTYYPVTIPIDSGRATTFRIENALNANVPSWSTHPSGFSVYIEWVSNGNGWGTIAFTRRIVDWRESATNVTIVGGLSQLSFSSEEVIWLRGGGVYHFFADNDVTPTVRTSNYTSPYGQSANTSATVVNSPWAATTGVGPGFPGMYVNGVLRLNTDNSYMIGCPTYGYKFNNNADTINALVVNNSGQCTAYADFRAPIFYDSDNTGYYLNPAGSSNLSGGNVDSVWTFASNLGLTSGALSNPPLQVYSSSNNSAFMSFHRSGYYAVNMGLDSDNVFRIGGWSATANRLQMDMSGNLTMAGTITASSDIRIKDNIETIQNGLEKVLQLNGVTFTRKDQEDKEKLHVGLIAQEVEKILPEVVSEDGEGMKSVAYGNMVGLLIEAIKEQNEIIKDMKNEIEELKTKISV